MPRSMQQGILAGLREKGDGTAWGRMERRRRPGPVAAVEKVDLDRELAEGMRELCAGPDLEGDDAAVLRSRQAIKRG